MRSRRWRRTLTVTPLFAADPAAPTLAQLQAQAFPTLTRLFVATLRQRRQQDTETPGRA